MAVYAKAKTSDDIINGIVVVCPQGTSNYKYDNTQRTEHFPSGDSLRIYQVLETRYKVDPSGWSS